MELIPVWLEDSLRLAKADNVRIRMETAALVDEFVRLREALEAARSDLAASQSRN